MSDWLPQSIRFGIVGLTSNLVLYLFYVVLIKYGLDPKLVISLSYAISMVWTFILNKRWSFAHQGNWWTSSTKFLLFYVSLYIINLTILYITVDIFNLSPILVQAIVFFVYVPIVFIVQRYWIFRIQPTN